MAVKKTAEALGTIPVPVPDEFGELKEVRIVWDTAAAADGVINNGDYLQVMKIPAGTVLSSVDVFSSATFGATTTFELGIATSATASTNATVLLVAANQTTSVRSVSQITLATIAPIDAPTANQGILGILVGGANTDADIKLNIVVKYRMARRGV